MMEIKLNRVLFFLVAIIIILAAPPSNADYLVDTGPMVQGGYGGADVYAANPPTSPYSPQQFVAGEFTLSTPSLITSFAGWMASDRDGTMSAMLYSDANGFPSVPIDQSSFAVQRLTWQYGVAAGWFGANSLNWIIPAGTYWLSFEVQPTDSLFGVLPSSGGVTMDGTAPNPLAGYAYNDGSGWTPDPLPNPNASYGIRITGNALPLPETSTYSMMLLGLVILSGVGWRRRVASESLNEPT